MASNDPLKPVELSPEPPADPPASGAETPPSEAAAHAAAPAATADPGRAGTAGAKTSPIKAIKEKIPVVVEDLKQTNKRLTEKNAKVEGEMDSINLKMAAAGVRLWGSLVKLRNDIATGTLKLIAAMDDSPKTPPAAAAAAPAAAAPAGGPPYPATAAAAAAPPTEKAVDVVDAQPEAPAEVEKVAAEPDEENDEDEQEES
eukprot:CAMPEP_0182920466 /NCGR_PEP_ID=MMETSP0105_2-20130417/3480_1 /TAXON_ID=81532 ORGANISM="Acanthoeca-like sp., Strain 10tr" /NCGR_SAMPLE_ID=MMETSP0105_2 /ASSEMBLY_ACC=CAM_ASM_000205 /LENGTH=200 /DNA_ID=CAMNT_0025057861 /DNA_START=153 /DNA_END=755 /DNA_ORIENTATION=+